jgi:hypothetical protein
MKMQSLEYDYLQVKFVCIGKKMGPLKYLTYYYDSPSRYKSALSRV